MIGDSLGVGTEQYLRGALSGPLQIDVKGGRSLAEGMRIYDQVGQKPAVVEMGLFTNDDPRHVDELRRAVERTIADARARGGRVVWATIVRPAVGGVSYDKANDMLRDLARRNADVMGLVDWQRAVQQHPDYLAADRIHGTTAGYRYRAMAFADAARS